jgi:hypothetical protein
VGGADEHARVPVVAAGVHLALDLGGEREAGLLRYGQGVHVSPQAHRGPVSPAFQRRDDAVLGEAGLNIQRQPVQRVQRLARGLLRVEAELGFPVDGLTEGGDPPPEPHLYLGLQVV